MDFGVKPVIVHGCDVKVNFWDLSGHPEFFDVRNEFYKDTQGVVLCFDVSQRVTFQALDKWVQEAQRYGVRDSAVWAVCANKVDKKTKRAVTRREAELWAERAGFEYFETSAKTGQGVREMFAQIVRDLPSLDAGKNDALDMQDLRASQKKKKGCC